MKKSRLFLLVTPALVGWALWGNYDLDDITEHTMSGPGDEYYGYSSAAFSYQVEASTDYESWDEPIILIPTPSGLPTPPAGYKFITFRQQAASDERTFFRTTVTETAP